MTNSSPISLIVILNRRINRQKLQKFQGPRQISQTVKSAKDLRTLREFDFEGQWDLITQLPQDWGSRPLEDTTKPWVHQEPGERSSDPTRDWARLACECPGASRRGAGWQWPAMGSGALAATVLGATACWCKSFWRRSPLLPLPPLPPP